MDKPDLPILELKPASQWRKWLDKNHSKSNGAWLMLFKKSSGVATLSHSTALEEALCYGWIDGQAKGFDEQSWLQKFTPRRPRSIWSKKNIEHVQRLIKEGKMQPAGLKEIEAAKHDGRWDRAYDSPTNMQVPDDFLNALSKNKKAKAFFDTLNRTNTFSIGWRLQTAKKPETREKRIKEIIAMLEEGKKFH